ncbi:hypothetical protein Fmac_015576 [Flemingia macrophylla]|uniref:Uncharacterized protein n=1 Tax=Flemingia macrophylla TaxID=520843 RepID=A0ABD1MEY9_9FABA
MIVPNCFSPSLSHNKYVKKDNSDSNMTKWGMEDVNQLFLKRSCVDVLGQWFLRSVLFSSYNYLVKLLHDTAKFLL